MNRFLTRKKEKKRQPEPKPEPEPLNIAEALPSNDNFRTSLIMPGLSTRFSMLREQDDPNSKIGKASDDSVLSPKRQSRLHDYSFVTGNPGALSDIAEVSSIHGSLRPSNPSERQNSFDSHATEEGSVMTRARPGEGNVLFGGRQKVYKLSNTGTGQGKLLYDDDVHLSYFQKLKIQEKERLAAQEALEHNSTADEPSPTTESFNTRRETASSTNSGSNGRTSTAATSIISQRRTSANPAPASPTEQARAATKGRRLYDQGLDQQMQDRESSAMNRFNSFQRARGINGRATPPLMYTQTRSATNLNDRFTRGLALRSESPTMLNSPGFGNGRDAHSNGTSPTMSRPTSPLLLSPLSPLIPETEVTKALSIAINPQDRGKATASGAFNKPKQAFSEEAYAERTRRMQQERGASVPKLDQPRKLTLRERAEIEKRKQKTPTASPTEQKEAPAASPTEETEAPSAQSAFSVFQTAANQMKSPTTDASQVTPKPSPSSVQSVDSQKDATFFASSATSEDEDEATPMVSMSAERGRRMENLPTATGPAPSILEHPALRSQSNSRPTENSEHPALRERSNSRPTQPEIRMSAGTEAETTDKPKESDLDSPTLGPNNGGLSVLVRQHLRSASNVSSIYDDNEGIISPPPLQMQHVGLQRRQAASDNESLTHSGYSHSNPWDLDDIESNPFHADRGSMSSVSPTSEVPKPRALALSPTQETFGEDLDLHRNPSVDEHEAFQRDLAQRQRAIQQSLRAKTEGRPASPSRVPAPTSGGLKNALNMLRAKSSRESFAIVDNNAKRLGLGATLNGGSTTSLAGEQSSRRPPRLQQEKGKSPKTSSKGFTRDRSSSELSAGLATEGKQSKTRSRSSSKSTAANFFESKHLQPLKTSGNGTTRLSPGLPVSPRPSPGNPGPNLNAFRTKGSFSANTTPPVSNPATPVRVAFDPKAVPQPMDKFGALRKKSIAKADIGEPVFLSTTSVVGTVSLADATIKNKEMMNAEAVPPVPPINPRRRFGAGDSEYYDPAIQYGMDAPNAPFMKQFRSNSSDAASDHSFLPKQSPRSVASEGKNLRGLARSRTEGPMGSPSSPFARGSPPRPMYAQSNAPKNMDGAMF
ncbi:hypothetical protein P280DRAFT_391502 [Massarina eburnea CBS 473.64]|uniref:Uncharacterized protein n=1 Tax=Massarina eburnea CBS 473.64 TaxID=1395130 RepID=A0A6A6SDJ4_9PLEO|nr:hypothetical protein P280DRAFT_391502 [Massarina eburnea CBS 473.64]